MLAFLVGHDIKGPLEEGGDCTRELVCRLLALGERFGLDFGLELAPARFFSHYGRRLVERIGKRGRAVYTSGRISFRRSLKGWSSGFPSVFFLPFSTPSRMLFRSPSDFS